MHDIWDHDLVCIFAERLDSLIRVILVVTAYKFKTLNDIRLPIHQRDLPIRIYEN